VAISMRFDRIDAFWFTLLHELGHVKAGDGKKDDPPPVDIDLVGDAAQHSDAKDSRERTADYFASEFLVPKEELNDFIARTRPLYSKKKIVGFAHRIGVHPGIVVGRLQFQKEINFSHNREMLEKVRDILVQSSLADGWGTILPDAPEAS
jgi:HTH-type transcriptional regulator/antitoxin HigA